MMCQEIIRMRKNKREKMDKESTFYMEINLNLQLTYIHCRLRLPFKKLELLNPTQISNVHIRPQYQNHLHTF